MSTQGSASGEETRVKNGGNESAADASEKKPEDSNTGDPSTTSKTSGKANMSETRNDEEKQLRKKIAGYTGWITQYHKTVKDLEERHGAGENIEREREALWWKIIKIQADIKAAHYKLEVMQTENMDEDGAQLTKDRREEDDDELDVMIGILKSLNPVESSGEEDDEDNEDAFNILKSPQLPWDNNINEKPKKVLTVNGDTEETSHQQQQPQQSSLHQSSGTQMFPPNLMGSGMTMNQPRIQGMGSQAFQDLSRRMDPSNLFCPVPQVAGLYPHEQSALNQMYLKGMTLLPNIKLKTFSGEKSECFETWLAHFKSVVDKQPTVTKKGKFLFLMQSLSGKAENFIQKFTSGTVTDSNYEESLEMLTEIYGGETQAATKQMVEFNRLEPLCDMSADELTRVYVTINGVFKYHTEHKNKHELESTGSSCYRDARQKTGSFIRDFDMWVMLQNRPNNFVSLVEWLRMLHKCARIGDTLDGGSHGEGTYTSNAATSSNKEAWKGRKDSSSKNKGPRNTKPSNDRKTKGADQKKNNCPCCLKKEHRMDNCEDFKSLEPKERTQFCRKNDICLHCLRTGHPTDKCWTSPDRQCGKNDCKHLHHKLLHWEKYRKEKTRKSTNVAVESDDSSEDEEVNNFATKRSNHGYVSIKVGTVMVHYKGKSIEANVLLDSGSNNSNVTMDLVNQLEMKLNGEPFERTLNVAGGKRYKITSQEVVFEISPKNPPPEFKKLKLGKSMRYEINAFTMPSVCGKTAVRDWNTVKNDYPHLKDVKIPVIKGKPTIDIMIGCDYPGLICCLESRSSKNIQDPIAHLTRLGWFMMGPMGKTGKRKDNQMLCYRSVQSRDEDEDLNKMAKKYWDFHEPQTSSDFRFTRCVTQTEALSNQEEKFNLAKFSARKRTFPSEQDQNAYDKMVVDFSEEDNRYVAAIPWKDEKPKLKTNREQVVRRQASTLSAPYLKKKGVTFEELKEIIEGYMTKGYVKKLTVNEIQRDSWYLPSFPIVNRSRKTTKIRLVFDAAAKFNGNSLNSEIMTGPNLLLNFLQVLLRFRKFKFAFLGDISEMFLQIGLKLEDRKYHRFVFGNPEDGMEDYEWQRTLFGGTSIPNASQKTLHTAVEDHGKNLKEGSETILFSTYMDDSADSRHTEKEVETCIKELTTILTKAQMIPRKWMTNSKMVLEQIPEVDRAKEVELIGSELKLNENKILGVVWSPEDDNFLLKGDPSPGGKTARSKKLTEPQNQWTRRTVLSTLFKLFDPLGLVSPFAIRGKIILQRLTTLNSTWDDPIPEDYERMWHSWLDDLKHMSMIKVPRHIGYEPNCSYEIHCFVDSSLEAYCAVFYLRTETENGIRVRFIYSKTRVTPLKAVTVARLELMAAFLGAECSTFIRSYLGLHEKVYFWTDSQDVLYWLLQPSKLFKPFIANRAGKIQAMTDIKRWNYVNTKINSADIGSRGSTIPNLSEDKLWWEGPEFLSKNKDRWPAKFTISSLKVEDASRKEFRPLLNLFGNFEEDQINAYLDPSKHTVGKLYNGYERLLRKTKMLLTFLTKIDDNERTCKAERILMMMAQAKSYEDVIQCLENKKPLPDKCSLKTLAPFIGEDGLLRARSRLENTDVIPDSARFPIILPSKSDFTKLYVANLHQKLQHPVGSNALKAHLWKKVIIPSYYFVERRILKSCVDCVIRTAARANQIMAPLPSFRYEEPLKAFDKIGIDFMGPFHIRELKKTRAHRERPKYYVLVITCLVVRAVHLEVTPGMDTQTVFNALSRFCDKRGVPSLILSDNQTSFTSTNNEIQEMYKKIDLNKLAEMTKNGYKLSTGIKWKFNPPTGPHHGGVYEIIVKAAKRALYTVFGHSDLTLDEFTTAISNAEGLLNSRPIAKTSPKPEDAPALTPNHFLVGQNGGDLAPPTNADPSNLMIRWRRLQEVQSHFWSRFHKEIITQLHPRQKWHKPRRNLQAGDLVVELDESQPRRLWKIGAIKEVFKSQDNNVRSVLVKYLHGGSTLKRPITQLLPIETEQ